MSDVLPSETRVALAYAWLRGNCYRCGKRNVHTAAVGHVSPAGVAPVTVRACKSCTLSLEQERANAAARYGWPYEPGTKPLGAHPVLSQRAR